MQQFDNIHVKIFFPCLFSVHNTISSSRHEQVCFLCYCIIILFLLYYYKYNIIWYNFCVGSISQGFAAIKKNEICLNCMVYDFSIDHSSFTKEDARNIQQYLMIKNKIK